MESSTSTAPFLPLPPPKPASLGMTEACLANAKLRAAAAEDKRTIAALQTELGETKEMLQVAQVRNRYHETRINSSILKVYYL